MKNGELLAAEQFHGILAFIPDNSDFSFNEAVTRLQTAFLRRKVRAICEGGNSAIEIAAKRWQVVALLVDEPHVVEESREMAEWLAHHPRAKEIAACRRRIEFEGTNIVSPLCHKDMLKTCQVFGSFSGVIVFDLEKGKLVNE